MIYHTSRYQHILKHVQCDHSRQGTTPEPQRANVLAGVLRTAIAVIHLGREERVS